MSDTIRYLEDRKSSLLTISIVDDSRRNIFSAFLHLLTGNIQQFHIVF